MYMYVGTFSIFVAFSVVQRYFICPFFSCFNSFVSASYISVNINTDVTLKATQVVTVYFAVVETVSNSLCTEEIVLMDVIMLR
jgi:hypothetical protein